MLMLVGIFWGVRGNIIHEGNNIIETWSFIAIFSIRYNSC